MGLRTILYGYGKNHLLFYIIPEEADTVRMIFREYISGRTMKSIADELTSKGVEYYQGKTTWTKNAICRILENEHYVGDLEYPAIITREDFDTANAMKSGKGGKREVDTPEVALLKRRMYCAECGHRYTRRKNYSGTRERWECPNHCKYTYFLDDKALYGKLLTQINRVITEPELLHFEQTGEEWYEPSLELIRQDREIDRMMEQKNLTFLPVKGVIYDSASTRFDYCKTDYSKAITDKLIEYVRTLEPMNTLDFSLIDRIVKKIYVSGDGSLSIKYLNEKTVHEREDTEYAGNNDRAESCNENCG